MKTSNEGNASSSDLRCYLKKDGDVWIAVCVDLSLAAQSFSKQRAEKYLTSMIQEFVEDVTAGEDKEFREQLLSRRLPFFQRIEYYFFNTRSFMYRINPTGE
jgi:hypothetical protein